MKPPNLDAVADAVAVGIVVAVPVAVSVAVVVAIALAHDLVAPVAFAPVVVTASAAVAATSFTNSRTVLSSKEISRCCAKGAAQPGDHVGGGRAYSFLGAASDSQSAPSKTKHQKRSSGRLSTYIRTDEA